MSLICSSVMLEPISHGNHIIRKKAHIIFMKFKIGNWSEVGFRLHFWIQKLLPTNFKHSFLPTPPYHPSPFCKGGGNQDFKQDMLMGGIFFWNSSRGNKKGSLQYFVVVQWGELVMVGKFFLNQFQK